MSSEKIRALQLAALLAEYATCEPMATALLTTNAYVAVPESILTAPRANVVSYLVANTDVANAITARMVGRYRSAAENESYDYSDWQAIGAEVSIGASSTQEFSLPFNNVLYDQYAIQVKATVASSQGDAEVWGSARKMDHVPDDLYPLSARRLTVTVAAEVTNTIAVAIQSSHASADKYIATLYDAAMLNALAAAFTMAETGAGTGVSTTAKPTLLFTLSATGAATLTVTDVAAASGATLYLVLTPIDVLGPTQYVAITFD